MSRRTRVFGHHANIRAYISSYTLRISAISRVLASEWLIFSTRGEKLLYLLKKVNFLLSVKFYLGKQTVSASKYFPSHFSFILLRYNILMNILKKAIKESLLQLPLN